MAIYKAKELACYISNFYKQEKGNEISPIKLQKSLYFLFAYWGGFVRKSKRFPNSVEADFSKYDENLFDDKIEAWVYGPVVPSVYYEHDLQSYCKEEMFDNKEEIRNFINGLLIDLFEVSDFNLVEISHTDNSWKNNFDYADEYHNNEIEKEDIIIEYANK